MRMGRSRTVSLKVSSDTHIKTSFGICVDNEAFLSLPARLRDALRRLTVLVGAGRPDDCTYSVTITKGCIQRLDDENSKALSSGVAIGSMIEAEAAAVFAQHTQIIERHAELGREHCVASTGQALSASVGLASSRSMSWVAEPSELY